MPRQPAPRLGKGQTILFEGDSLTSRRSPPGMDTWAFLRLSNWQTTYAERMEEWLFCNRPDLGVKVRHSAVGGSTCRGLLERFERCVVPLRPDWVILTLGGNDSAQQIPLAEFRAKLSEYCQRLAKLSGGRVLVVGGFRPAPHLPEEKASSYQRRQTYYRALRQVLAKHRGVYLDVGLVLRKKAQLLFRQCPLHSIYSDGGHFNAIGAEIIAMQVLQAMGVLTIHENGEE